MTELSVYLLGTYHVVCRGQPVHEFRSDKARALLAYLALECDRPHRRETLAALFWPDVPDEVARRNLRLTLHRLRHTLGDLGPKSTFFHITRETVQCQPGAVWVDAVAFAQLVDAVQNHAHEHSDMCNLCVERLTQAAALYRGDFLEGFVLEDNLAFAEWTILKRERWHRMALCLMHRLTDYYRRRGQLDRARKYARRQLELEPWREEAHRQLMDILARSGEISAALAQYETCRRVLAEELNVGPDVETERLYRRIRRAREGPRHNLPAPDTSFVGRMREMEQIYHLLTTPSCRLVTILGAPGIGKTRLALEVAAKLTSRFLNGVWFVSLAGVRLPDDLATAIAQSLGITLHGHRPPEEQLLTYLRDQELLLVLDNFEHLLASSQRTGTSEHEALVLVKKILQQARDVKFLVTSRQRLRLQGEWVVEIRGLPYPAFQPEGWSNAQTPSPNLLTRADVPAYPAVQLFLARARQARWDFAPEEEWRAIVRICQLVEGLPLGIELAAAWVRHFSCQEIVQRIHQSLDFLSTSLEDVPERHVSLRAACEHSWRLLSPDEQKAFRRLSVFVGSFSAEAAAFVVDAPAEVLRALTDKSLLHRAHSGRYRMHELVREFAALKLRAAPDEAIMVRDRHARYYATYMQAHVNALKGEGQLAALDRLQEEIDNLRVAWMWAVDRRDEALVSQAMEGLFHFYELRGNFHEGERVFRLAAEAFAPVNSRPDTPEGAPGGYLHAKLLIRQGWFCWRLARYDVGKAVLLRGLSLIPKDEKGEMALGLGALGLIYHNKGAYEDALRCYTHSLALYQTLEEPWGLVRAHSRLGLFFYTLGYFEEAKQRFEAALALAESIGERRGMAFARAYLGLITCALGQHVEAKGHCEAALHLCRQSQDPYGVALSMAYLGRALGHLREDEEARHVLGEARALFQDLGDRHGEAFVLTQLGEAARLAGDYTEAWQWYEKGLELYRELDSCGGMAEVAGYLGCVALLHGQCVEARRFFRQSMTAIQKMPNARFMKRLLRQRWKRILTQSAS